MGRYHGRWGHMREGLVLSRCEWVWWGLWERTYVGGWLLVSQPPSYAAWRLRNPALTWPHPRWQRHAVMVCPTGWSRLGETWNFFMSLKQVQLLWFTTSIHSDLDDWESPPTYCCMYLMQPEDNTKRNILLEIKIIVRIHLMFKLWLSILVFEIRGRHFSLWYNESVKKIWRPLRRILVLYFLKASFPNPIIYISPLQISTQSLTTVLNQLTVSSTWFYHGSYL